MALRIVRTTMGTYLQVQDKNLYLLRRRINVLNIPVATAIELEHGLAPKA